MTPAQKLADKRKLPRQKPKIVKFDVSNPSPESHEELKTSNPGSTEKTHKRPKKGDKNYYQNFDFYFSRTCFRTMALYFKLEFKPFFDKWKAGKTKGTLIE